MKQIWIPKIGRPEVLEVREAPDPEVQPGEIRIHVKASGVNFADILARVGLYPDAPKLPTVVGYEVSGIVDQVGTNVSTFKEGDAVFSLTRFGGYSDCIVVPAAQASPLPKNLSFEKAAAIPVNYLTAWIMLVWLGHVRGGETVLVHAVAGGVGQAALQICKIHGAQVMGTASASKHERLKHGGVTHCIDYTTQDFETEVKKITQGKGVDIILDAVGGKSFKKSYKCLAPLGRLFLFGISSMSPKKTRSLPAALKGLLSMPRFHPISLMNDNRAVIGVNLGHLWGEGEKIRTMFQDMIPLFEKGVLDPVVDKTFSFDKAADAHTYLQDRKNFGKVLLIP